MSIPCRWVEGGIIYVKPDMTNILVCSHCNLKVGDVEKFFDHMGTHFRKEKLDSYKNEPEPEGTIIIEDSDDEDVINLNDDHDEKNVFMKDSKASLNSARPDYGLNIDLNPPMVRIHSASKEIHPNKSFASVNRQRKSVDSGISTPAPSPNTNILRPKGSQSGDDFFHLIPYRTSDPEEENREEEKEEEEEEEEEWQPPPRILRKRRMTISECITQEFFANERRLAKERLPDTEYYSFDNVRRPIRPFGCKICHTTTTTLEGFKKHFKKYHSSLPKFGKAKGSLNDDCTLCNHHVKRKDTEPVKRSTATSPMRIEEEVLMPSSFFDQSVSSFHEDQPLFSRRETYYNEYETKPVAIFEYDVKPPIGNNVDPRLQNRPNPSTQQQQQLQQQNWYGSHPYNSNISENMPVYQFPGISMPGGYTSHCYQNPNMSQNYSTYSNMNPPGFYN